MITHIRIENFKAIQSADISMRDLSVFIGNNGSGKSSVFEALHTLQKVIISNVSEAFTQRWYGIEKVRHQAANGKPIKIHIKGKIDNKQAYEYCVDFQGNANNDLYYISYEQLKWGKAVVFEKANVEMPNSQLSEAVLLSNEAKTFYGYVTSWQFLSLEPEKMYFPIPRNQGTRQVKLQSSGSNLADYFSRIMDKPELLDIIIAKMRYVLPDMVDFDAQHDGIRKEVFLNMAEKQYAAKLPSWLFSSGTLRILAMLTLLNTNNVPPIIFIEEVENGLDPRTLNLLVEEMRGLLSEGHQFILTTHSPYLLDLLDLKHVIVAEKNQGKTSYFRPQNDKSLLAWKDAFSLGRLYLMDKLRKQ